MLQVALNQRFNTEFLLMMLISRTSSHTHLLFFALSLCCSTYWFGHLESCW